MTRFVVDTEGTVTVPAMRRVGRVLPTYAAQLGADVRQTRYRRVGFGVVDGMGVTIYAEIGWRYVVCDAAYRFARWWMHGRSVGRIVAEDGWLMARRWWRRRIGYSEWEA